jgi:hypothetical protein
MTVLSATYLVPLVNPEHFVSSFLRIEKGKYSVYIPECTSIYSHVSKTCNIYCIVHSFD